MTYKMKFCGIVIRFAPALCVMTAAFGQTMVPDEPVTGAERLGWLAEYTAGPAVLLGTAFSAGYSTQNNQPYEYGTHWAGFGERYGMALATMATSNSMEAGLGILWGEDPRYFRPGEHASFGARAGHILKWTFVSPNRNGSLQPAYARYLAIGGSSFLADTWVEPGQANTTRALERAGFGILSRMAGNAFSEFWPDVKRKVFGLR